MNNKPMVDWEEAYEELFDENQELWEDNTNLRAALRQIVGRYHISQGEDSLGMVHIANQILDTE